MSESIGHETLGCVTQAKEGFNPPAPSAGRGRDRGSGRCLVEFDKVQKSYGQQRLAVADVTLSIEPGEFLTLLGPSGSGKTSTLMMLAGFEEPTSGEIRLRGKSLAHVPPHRRNMGVVFQNYALFPHMTVAENLSFPLFVRNVAKGEIRKRLQRALALVQLEGYHKRRPAELSGGQQQRVALARALIFDPDIVLMDEPLGALDKHLREKLQLEIKQIQSELGLTVLYVTHDQSEALTMSDRIAVFKDGRIQQIDSPRALYESPQNSFVALFLGESNSLSGQVLSNDGRKCSVDVGAGLIVSAVPANVGPTGSATMLSVRPERVVLAPSEAQCDNIVNARVSELVYFGDHMRVEVVIPDSRKLSLKLPNTRSGVAVTVGQDVSIGWHSSDCRALDVTSLAA